MAKQPKAVTYRTLCRINRCFDFITEQLGVLGKEGYLKPKMQRVLELPLVKPRQRLTCMLYRIWATVKTSVWKLVCVLLTRIAESQHDYWAAR
jgi:hypothetical protein